MGLFSKKNPNQKQAYCVYSASGMGLNSGVAYILQMAEIAQKCLKDYQSKEPDKFAKFEALSKLTGKKGEYKLNVSNVSNPLTVISTPKPFDAVQGAENEIVRNTGKSLNHLREEEGERFFCHTFQVAPPRKDIEYVICVMYYFEA